MNAPHATRFDSYTTDTGSQLPSVISFPSRSPPSHSWIPRNPLQAFPPESFQFQQRQKVNGRQARDGRFQTRPDGAGRGVATPGLAGEMMLMITPVSCCKLSPLLTVASAAGFKATATRGRPLGKLRPKRNLESRHLPQSVHVPSCSGGHRHILIYPMFQTGHSQMDDAINQSQPPWRRPARFFSSGRLHTSDRSSPILLRSVCA